MWCMHGIARYHVGLMVLKYLIQERVENKYNIKFRLLILFLMINMLLVYILLVVTYYYVRVL